MHGKTGLGIASALIALTAAACGGKHDDCQRFWDKASPIMAKMAPGKAMPADAKGQFLQQCRGGDQMRNDPVFRCVLDASGASAVSECMTKAVGDYKSASQATEARLQLSVLGKTLKAHHAVEAAFPAGTAGPTPAEPCCVGEGGMCAPSPDWATNPIWQQLDFMIDEPTRFQYTYQSDGKTVTAMAIGDLDCDGAPITYKLEMAVGPDGVPTMNVSEPAPNAD